MTDEQDDDGVAQRRRDGWIVGAAVGGALGVLGLLAMTGLGGGQSAAQEPAWLGRFAEKLERGAYDWVQVGFADSIATVSGQAETPEIKEAAFAAIERELSADIEAMKDVKLVVDAISVRDGEAGVGAALAALGAKPDLAACQAAFNATMAGRTINFESGQASVSPQSARLLDALTGVAIRCRAFTVEIGGHTDRRGRDEANLALSRERAEAVKAYLVGRGVGEAGLTAIGYGETKPLDPAQTEDADAKNRRIDFTVASAP